MKKIGIVYGTFHGKEIEQMLGFAREEARDCDLEIIAEIAVPGSVEAPLAAKRLLEAGDVDEQRHEQNEYKNDQQCPE